MRTYFELIEQIMQNNLENVNILLHNYRQLCEDELDRLLIFCNKKETAMYIEKWEYKKRRKINYENLSSKFIMNLQKKCNLEINSIENEKKNQHEFNDKNNKSVYDIKYKNKNHNKSNIKDIYKDHVLNLKNETQNLSNLKNYNPPVLNLKIENQRKPNFNYENNYTNIINESLTDIETQKFDKNDFLTKKNSKTNSENSFCDDFCKSITVDELSIKNDNLNNDTIDITNYKQNYDLIVNSHCNKNNKFKENIFDYNLKDFRKDCTKENINSTIDDYIKNLKNKKDQLLKIESKTNVINIKEQNKTKNVNLNNSHHIEKEIYINNQICDKIENFSNVTKHKNLSSEKNFITKKNNFKRTLKFILIDNQKKNISKNDLNQKNFLIEKKNPSKKMSDYENEENEYNRSKEAQEKALKEYLIKEPLQNKLVILFYEAMKSNLNYFDPDLIASVCSSIVDELVLTKKIDDKNLVRSKIWNLKDRENPFLCEKVYNGIFTPKKYVEMSNDEMKSEEIKLIDEKAAQDSLFDAQFAKLEAETDIFRCGKCKQRKTTYQQLQTRGADEPMTTFVTCVVCKNRWKF